MKPFKKVEEVGAGTINQASDAVQGQIKGAQDKVDSFMSKGREMAKGASDKFNSIMGKLNGKKKTNKPDPSEPDQKDFCNQPVEDKGDKGGAPNKKSFKDKVKGAIDKIFDPLDSTKGAYGNAGYTSHNMFQNTTVSYEISYDLVNLEPNNPYDIYYRDEDEIMWDRNRRSTNMKINANVQTIHDTIVVPFRARVKEMFGESVIVRVEYCFMCLDALVKHRLPSDHLFSQARAVMLRIENEKASVIYDDILRFCAEDYEDLEDDRAQPFDYGLMKLCSSDKEKERIYITLPFTKEEIEEDPLLSGNKSNFQHSSSNGLGIIPDSSTSTKVFPAYHPDNDVEDFFNELDDADEKIEEIEKKIEEAKEEENRGELEKLKQEKFELEQFKQDLLNPDFSSSDLEKDKKKAEKLYTKFPTEENKKLIELATKELGKFPSDDDTLTVAVGKINSISVTIQSNLDITGEHEDYFTARKLYKLSLAIRCRKAMKFNLSDKALEELYTERIKAYEKVRGHKLQELVREYTERKKAYYEETQEVTDKYNEDYKVYQEKYKEYLEQKSSSTGDTSSLLEPEPPEQVSIEDYNEPMPTVDDVDMEDLIYPTKEDILAEKQKEFDSVLVELERIYNENDIKALDAIQTDFPLNIVKFSDERKNDMEKVEYSKFPSLKVLVEECDRYKGYITAKRNYNTFGNLASYFRSNNYPDEYKWFLTDKSDYTEIMDFYYSIIKSTRSAQENIDTKIERSKAIVHIARGRNFNITYIPSSESPEYSKFVLEYLLIETMHANNVQDYNRIAELEKLKAEYEEYVKNKEFSKLNINNFKSDIFQFGDGEYEASKMKFLINLYENENENSRRRVLAYIAYKVMVTRAEICEKDWFTNCNPLGKESLDNQVLSNLFDPIYKDTKNWLESVSEKLVGLESIDRDTLYRLGKIDEFITSKTASLNTYLTKYNDFILNILYSPNMTIRVNKVYKANKRNYSFIDYGCEYITLQKQVADSKNAEDEDGIYRARLKQDRIMMKRQLIYLMLEETAKKISNYELEMVAAIDFGKLNRFKKINDVIIPELKRLKELRDTFEPNDNATDKYEEQKRVEKERLTYLFSQNPTDTALLYRKATLEITMDYENDKGIFENINKTKDERYLMYLEGLLDALAKENNSSLNNEVTTIRDEINYLRDVGEAKRNKKNKIIQQIKESKMKLDAELERRETDKEYLHYRMRITDIENGLKLKYKEFTKIENLPSKGVVFKFPFKEYEEFKLIYESTLDLPTKISEYEILDAYYQYSNMNFTYFDNNRREAIEKMHSYWEGVNYEPNPETMTSDIHKYLILLDEGIEKNFSKSIGRSLYCINGFIDIDTVIMTDNNLDYTTAILVKMRRTIEFEDDLKYFMTAMCKQKHDLVDAIKVIPKD